MLAEPCLLRPGRVVITKPCARLCMPWCSKGSSHSSASLSCAIRPFMRQTSSTIATSCGRGSRALQTHITFPKGLKAVSSIRCWPAQSFNIPISKPCKNLARGRQARILCKGDQWLAILALTWFLRRKTFESIRQERSPQNKPGMCCAGRSI